MDDRPPQERNRAQQRSLFWPLVLLEWHHLLLSNLGSYRQAACGLLLGSGPCC